VAAAVSLDGIDLLLLAGVAYAVLDLILAFTKGRCCLPGLKCGACRG